MEPLLSLNPMLATPDLFGRRHKYRRCELSDIGHHYEQIKHWVTDIEEKDFQKRMVECVKQGNAWCTKNTFIYYESQNKRIAYGVALFGKKNTLELIGLLIGVFWMQDKYTQHLRFRLHVGKVLEEYKNMLTVTSVKRNHENPDHPLMVNIDKLRKKFHKILLSKVPK